MAFTQTDLSCITQDALPAFCNACQVRKVSICGDLTNHELRNLQSAMASRDVEKGVAIVHQDDEVHSLHIVTHGAFRLLKVLEDGRQQITGFGFPGDYIGVRAGAKSNYTVEALIPGRVCTFPHTLLKRLSVEHPSIQDRLIGNADTELTKAYNHMVLLGQKTVHERVATFMCDLVTQIGKPIDGENGDAFEVAVPMSRRDIADYLALRSETLSRVLKDLKTSHLIQEVTRQKMIVPSLSELQQRALADVC